MRENKVMGIIFSNMHDEVLGRLTAHRTTGSVPYGGRYRLIDFVLSSMVNSDITDIGIITKMNYQSLMDHVGSGRPWDLARKRGGLVLLPPFASSQAGGIYRGRLEALQGALSYIRHNDAKYVLLCDCDIIANIDLRDMINEHMRSGAQITLMCKRAQVRPEGLREVTVVDYDEQDMEITDIKVRPADVRGEQNIYMNVMLLEKELLERMSIKVYPFTGYTYRISGMQSYFAANMELLDPQVRSQLFPLDRPVYTKVRDQVPVKYGLSSRVGNSLIADGCIINGDVQNCIIFRGAKIGRNAVLKNCIIMQDTYVGDNAHLEYVITDKDVLIKDSRVLIGIDTYPTYISKGSTI